ncbi:MAG: response regulator [Desulfobulbaceae bacterium]|nr:response regulator [Desulfobulbaceae bacterium]
MKILVVDDFDTMHKIIRDILIELGYEDILQAYNGEGALYHLNREKIDLIISDWNMPKMTGLELLKAVRTNPELADTPFIMVTAEAEKDNIAEAIKADVDQYVIKPFNAKMLIEKIKFALRKRKK